MSEPESEIRAVEFPSVEAVSGKSEKGSSNGNYKKETKAEELFRKAKDFSAEAQRDFKGTVDRVFDIYETPNYFQVVWLIVFLITVGVLILSNNVFVTSISIVAVVLLFVGIVGYLVYKPVSLSTFSIKSYLQPKENQKNTDADRVNTSAASDALLNEKEENDLEAPPKLLLPPTV